jgi:hypothetical protein
LDARSPFGGRRVGDKFVYPERKVFVDDLRSRIKEVSSGDPQLDRIISRVEEGQAADIGEWSTFLRWSEDGPKKAVAVYSDKEPSSYFDERAFERALEHLHSQVRSQTIDISTIEKAIHGTQTSDPGDVIETGLDTTTNSGYPYFNPGWAPDPEGLNSDNSDKQKAYEYAKSEAERLLRESNDQSASVPHFIAVSFQRLVQKGEDVANEKRKRLVIGFPKEDAILHKLYTPRLMIELRKGVCTGGVRRMCGWTNLPVIDANMQHMMYEAESKGRTVLSGDVSNFDASVPPRILLAVGNVIADWVRGYSALVNKLIEAFVINTTLITPNKIYPATPSSVKSGSGITNLIDSEVLLTAIYYGEELGLYKVHNEAVNGDDFVVDGDGITGESIQESFAHFGLIVHPEKQFSERKALHYLQRLHWLGRPGGMASVFRTLGHVLSLERMPSRKDWNSYAYIVRALSQIQNCVFNPYFSKLVDLFKENDKYELGAIFSNPDDLVAKAGPAGQEMISIDTNRPWKSTGGNTQFKNWLVNGYLRGEMIPPPGVALFTRVYGKMPPR